MRGLEPPQSYLHTDLNRARLPIPPHPQAGVPTISHALRRRGPQGLWYPPTPVSPLSSRGLGRRPLTAETRVRIPVAVSRSSQRRHLQGRSNRFVCRFSSSPAVPHAVTLGKR